MPKKTTSSRSRRTHPAAVGVPSASARRLPAAHPVNGAGPQAGSGRARSSASRGPGSRAPDRDGPGDASPRVDLGSVTEWDLLTRASQDEIEQLVEVLEGGEGGATSPSGCRTGATAILAARRRGPERRPPAQRARLERAPARRKIVGREGRMTERASVGPAKGAWAAGMSAVNQLIGDLVAPTNEVARVITGGREGRPVAEDLARHRGSPGPRRVPPHRHDRELDGRSAELVRGRGDARREGGRHRGQARRPGRREGRQRHLEGPHRQRERAWPSNLTVQVRDIAKVTTAIANGDLAPEDHRRREGRDPPDQEHHQQDGRPAELVRRGGDPRRAGGRHGGQARRPGGRAGRQPAPGRTSPTT